MKALAPTKVCRDRSGRGSPRTLAIGVGSATAGMWQSWHVRNSRDEPDAPPA